MLKEFKLSNILSIVACLLGVSLCYLLQREFSLTSITASALVGFLASFIPSSKVYDHKKLIAAFYTGSFSAMCNLKLFPHLSLVLLLGIITTVFFIFLGEKFRGHGGKLGTLAFISSCLFYIILMAGGIIA